MTNTTGRRLLLAGAAIALGLTATTLVATPRAAATATNLLVNGSFTADLSTGWTVTGDGCGSPEWTSGLVVNGSWSPTGIDGPGVWLNGCGFPDGNPTLSQTITVTSGTSYTVSGYVHAGYENTLSDGLANFEVRVDGTALTLTVGTADEAGWALFTGTFTATGSTALVAFIAETNGDSEVLADSFSVVASEVQTPVTPQPPAPPVVDTTTTSVTSAPPARGVAASTGDDGLPSPLLAVGLLGLLAVTPEALRAVSRIPVPPRKRRFDLFI